MGEPSSRERVAFEVVRRILGAAVEHHDTEGRQGAVDALVLYGDGTRAALEVTTLTDQASHEVETLLAADDFTWELPGCSWWWTVTVPPVADLRAVRKGLPALARWCEEHGVEHPGVRSLVHGIPGADDWTRWLDVTKVSVFGNRERAAGAGTATVMPAGKGGAVGNLSAVPAWLTNELRSPRTQRKVSKLLTAGLEETHLFLIVDDTGAPFAGFYAMAFGTELPHTAPETAGLTSVWLAPRWSPTVLRYDVRLGWSRHAPYDSSGP